MGPTPLSISQIGSNDPHSNRKARRTYAFKNNGPKVMTPGIDETVHWGYQYNSKRKLKLMHPPARIVFREYTRTSRAGVKYTSYAKYLQHGTYKTK